MTVDIEKVKAALDGATPGPWGIRNLRNFGTDVVAGDEFEPQRVARTPTDHNCPDARLIALAPDLARALVECVEAMTTCSELANAGMYDEALEENRAALAKIGIEP